VRWLLLVVTASLALAPREASACFAASQQLRYLLGESRDGLVWANLEMDRRGGDPGGADLSWQVTAIVEHTPWGGGAATRVEGLREVTWKQSAEMRSAEPDLALSRHLHRLAAQIQLPGFRAPASYRAFDCGAALACGDWRLRRAAGQVEVVGPKPHPPIAVVVSRQFAAKAAIDGQTSPEWEARLPGLLAITAFSEYRTSRGPVRVFNLAHGDFRFNGRSEDPAAHSRPRPMRVAKRCAPATTCYAIPWTTLHGAHLEVASLATVR
jgi:hypothetical protein